MSSDELMAICPRTDLPFGLSVFVAEGGRCNMPDGMTKGCPRCGERHRVRVVDNVPEVIA